MAYHTLSDDKLRHISEVSRLMYEAAIAMYWPEEVAQEMALLGFVHDIGYMIQKQDHAKTGGNILTRTGYAYSNEVTHHGKLIDNPSPAQALLWHADLSVGPQGQRMNYDERLADIENRYGPDSNAANNVRETIAWLTKHFPADYVAKEHGGYATSVPKTGEQARQGGTL